MDLFHFQDDAPGTVFWHPKGWALFQKLIAYMRRRCDDEGYVEVNSPQLLDRSLWETSGHWETYHENMFVTETEDERVFALKPMNCPGHVQIFKHGLRSYRELPLKIAEFGIVHRYEPSGALHGLMRVRAFTQDDAHIFCTEDQIAEQCLEINRFMLSIYEHYGFNDIHIKLATRPEKRVGADEPVGQGGSGDEGRARPARLDQAQPDDQDVDRGRRRRVLRSEVRISSARRDRADVAVRHDAGRLQPAGPLRRVLHRRSLARRRRR